MVAQDDDSVTQDESRPPTLEDLLSLCSELNRQKAKYIVIGGMAMLQQGFTRATEDIDLLVDASSKNFHRVREALLSLPDQAAKELADSDLETYSVIRVADEIVVDLMSEACGLGYSSAEEGIQWVKIRSVEIPFASAELMLKLKQGVREKDVLDRRFLTALLAGKKK